MTTKSKDNMGIQDDEENTAITSHPTAFLHAHRTPHSCTTTQPGPEIEHRRCSTEHRTLQCILCGADGAATTPHGNHHHHPSIHLTAHPTPASQMHPKQIIRNP
ncbi:hypothetical protein FA15DRAFT_673705 [Coprinopsis marcescibilis]|uniref:Uncharacterized protein n=1 Tax=Coprinopsis marcescibilis TaxID=230819 RepID=A0A5C3KK15_COPMA|nr:hypothetical protein FA15DRAFT_673705 [Coprinopsis marcescibilis]